MALLDDLSTLLAGVGTTVWNGRLLEEPDAALALIETTPLPHERVMDQGPGTGVAAERPGIQVLSRDRTYEGARLIAVAALNALDNYGPGVINGTYYAAIEALQRPPYYIGQDANDRMQFSFNVMVTQTMTT